MKRNNKLTLLTIATLLTMGMMLTAGCTKNGEKKQDNPTLLLYLAQGNTASPDKAEQTCLGAYALANSCVAGSQFFNAGIGCSKAKLKDQATYDALKACVVAGITDPIQPCNLTQFKYAEAQQSVATGAAFNKCTKPYVSGTTTTDLTGVLVY
ncbi:hypothetical protein LPTSP3_g05960 [Leptospira kobayashii]|uniref:Lipoprotein n=1 Tax=Leptospira kobayashii TaxID=1917830 RepID=A0ABM7UGC7_9LEPT|nr:hypothetical protein [Leptospira kobayashii]BDA77666.1 hypothetical protein LPTSP3_g05960 [Leptospira kobayashii]